MNETYRIDRYVAAKKRYMKSLAETEKLKREMNKAAHLLLGHGPNNSNLTQTQFNFINTMIQRERRYRMANRVLSRSLPRNLRNRILNV
jgi:hypothetical protein